VNVRAIVIIVSLVGRGAELSRRAVWVHQVGRVLIVVGVLMVLYWGSGFVLDAWRQHGDEARWNQIVAAAAAQGPRARILARPMEGMDFKLVVPKLGYDAVVREGIGLDVLTAGPGHYPGTAWPGEVGVVGIAAHNVYWIRFDQLGAGDRVAVQTRYGTFNYSITGTRIVAADNTSVLRPGPGRQLTLTTCWPLWAGEFARDRLAIFATSAP
jgi:sortase A